MKTSASGNFGFVAVNNGTIKNLNIESCLTVLHSNVNVGTFAGVNNGTITGCTADKLFYIPYHQYVIINNKYSIPNNASYLGGIAGRNTGTIQDCKNYGIIETQSSAGGIAGINTGRIERSWNYGKIYYTFYMANAHIGGIAGVQNSSGQSNGIFYCINLGLIQYADSASTSTTLQPSMAQIVGYNQQGNFVSTSWQYGTLTGTVDKGTLQVVGTHNQALYVGDREAGR
jgi:hypothetical protein